MFYLQSFNHGARAPTITYLMKLFLDNEQLCQLAQFVLIDEVCDYTMEDNGRIVPYIPDKMDSVCPQISIGAVLNWLPPTIPSGVPYPSQMPLNIGKSPLDSGLVWTLTYGTDETWYVYEFDEPELIDGAFNLLMKLFHDGRITQPNNGH